MRSSAAALDCSGNGFVAEIVDRVGVSWDSTACGFSDFTLEQSASYMASRWGASRLRGLILRGAMSGEIEASALVLVAALPLINAGLAYVKFGPMWRRANQPARPEVLEAALCAIRQHFAGDLGLLVRVMPPAEPIWQDSWTESLARAGYRLYRPVPILNVISSICG